MTKRRGRQPISKLGVASNSIPVAVASNGIRVAPLGVDAGLSYSSPMHYDPFDEIRREASGIDLTPPQTVADNAARGLALRQQFGRGGTEIGVGVATGLSERRAQTPEMLRRMVSYFARHEVDKRGKNFGNAQNPSAGHIAWLLWGGDAGREWALATKARLGGVGRASGHSVETMP